MPMIPTNQETNNQSKSINFPNGSALTFLTIKFTIFSAK